jgi:hypothetical protein
VHWKLKILLPTSLRRAFRHAWLAGFSPTVQRTRATLVEVSSESDLENATVDSAAVLIKFENVERMYHKLAKRGAVCLLTWAEPKSKAYEDCALITSLPSRTDNPIPVYDISRNDARALRQQLANKSRVDIEFSSKTLVQNGISKSVVATLKGKRSQYYIVCAHGDSDSGGPGADDNGSGDSGVLELARVFRTMIQERRLSTPEYSIKFIVWGSEYASAENYVKTHSSELDSIRGVLNFDEIGTGASRNCIYFEGNDQRVNADLLRRLQKVGVDYVGKRGFWKEATTNPSQGGTDSYVFLPSYLGRLGVRVVEIPSVTVYTAAWQEPKTLFQPSEWRTKAWNGPADSVTIDYSMYYHSSMDLPSTTTDREPYNMVWGVKAVGLTLLRLNWNSPGNVGDLDSPPSIR